MRGWNRRGKGCSWREELEVISLSAGFLEPGQADSVLRIDFERVLWSWMPMCANGLSFYTAGKHKEGTHDMLHMHEIYAMVEQHFLSSPSRCFLDLMRPPSKSHLPRLCPPPPFRSPISPPPSSHFLSPTRTPSVL